jgi:hypothetical protein
VADTYERVRFIHDGRHYKVMVYRISDNFVSVRVQALTADGWLDIGPANIEHETCLQTPAPPSSRRQD